MNSLEPKKVRITEKEMRHTVMAIACEIEDNFKDCSIITFSNSGIHATSLIVQELSFKPTVLALDPARFIEANSLVLGFLSKKKVVIIDDVVDSGKTVKRFDGIFGGVDHYYFLVEKKGDYRIYTPEKDKVTAPIVKNGLAYIVFPWEED